MVRYRVVGLHATSWDERDERGDCGGERELADARRTQGGGYRPIQYVQSG